MTVSKTIRENDELLKNATGDEAGLLREVKEFFFKLDGMHAAT